MCALHAFAGCSIARSACVLGSMCALAGKQKELSPCVPAQARLLPPHDGTIRRVVIACHARLCHCRPNRADPCPETVSSCQGESPQENLRVKPAHLQLSTARQQEGNPVQGFRSTATTWLPVRLSFCRICSTSRAGVHTRIPAGVSRLPGDAGHLAAGTTSGGHLIPHSNRRLQLVGLFTHSHPAPMPPRGCPAALAARLLAHQRKAPEPIQWWAGHVVLAVNLTCNTLPRRATQWLTFLPRQSTPQSLRVVMSSGCNQEDSTQGSWNFPFPRASSQSSTHGRSCVVQAQVQIA